MRVDSRLHPAPLTRTSQTTRRTSSAEFAKLLQPQTPAASQPAAPAVAAGRGPQITLRSTPAPNPWNYQGPAALNPYYATAEDPLRNGRVAGYDKWFEPVHLVPSASVQGGGGTLAAPYGATEAAAREALRLVQQYVPDARLEAAPPGGAWNTDKPVYHIVVGEERLAAGLILDRYYNHGQGVTAASDIELAAELRQIPRTSV